jgi:hypothetical protein
MRWFSRHQFLILPLGLAFVGLSAIGIGLIMARSPLTCGPHVVRPGDTCTYTNDGSAPEKDTYVQMKKVQKQNQIAYITVGAILSAGAPVSLVVIARRRSGT